MTRTLVIAAIIVAFALGAVSQRNAQGLNVNSRWMMRGARCTNWRETDISKPPVEDRFQELATVRVSQTYDKKRWVIGFEDYDGCRLSFWAESAEMDKPVVVRSLTSY